MTHARPYPKTPEPRVSTRANQRSRMQATGTTPDAPPPIRTATVKERAHPNRDRKGASTSEPRL